MINSRSFVWLLLATSLAGCANHKPLPYGEEASLMLPGQKQQVWAIAPAINLSGQSPVDPLLQSDLVYGEMQQVKGLTVIPVDRVVAVYATLRIDKVQSEQQAYAVCDLLGCDGLVVPTVTAFDPYEPPKFGGSLQLFRKPGSYSAAGLVDPHDLARLPAPGADQSMTPAAATVQAVAMLDAADGSVRQRIARYAAGRSNPNGPYREKEILVSMDRYCGFAYHELIAALLDDSTTGPAPRPTISAHEPIYGDRVPNDLPSGAVR